MQLFDCYMLDVWTLSWASFSRVLYLVSRQGFVFKGKRIESIHFVYLGIFCSPPYDCLCVVHLTLLSFCHRLAQFLLTLFLCLICSLFHTALFAGVVLRYIHKAKRHDKACSDNYKFLKNVNELAAQYNKESDKI